MKISLPILVPARCTSDEAVLTVEERALQLASGSENESLRNIVLDACSALGETWVVKVAKWRSIQEQGVRLTFVCTCDREFRADVESLIAVLDERIAARSRKDDCKLVRSSDTAKSGVATASEPKAGEGSARRGSKPGNRQGPKDRRPMSARSGGEARTESRPQTDAEANAGAGGSPCENEGDDTFALQQLTVPEPEVRTVESCQAVRLLGFRRASVDFCLWLVADGVVPPECGETLVDELAGKKACNQGMWRLKAMELVTNDKVPE